MQLKITNMKIWKLLGILPLVACLTGCTDASTSDDGLGNWKRSADFEGDRRANAVTFVIDEMAYVGLGYNGTEDEYFSDFYAYNYDLKYWVEVESAPGAGRTDGIGFAIDSYGYVGLGYDGENYLNDFYRYNPANDDWEEMAPFPGDPRRAAIGFSAGGNGYVGTGYDGGRDYQDFWEYNPSENQWTQIPSLGSRRRDAVSFSIGEKVYIGTGSDNGSLLVDFYEFDYTLLPSYPWKQLTDIDEEDDYEVERAGGVGFSVDGLGYVAFGTNGAMTRTVYQYDPASDIWTEKNSLESTVSSRRDAVAFVINNTPFVTTGSNSGVYYYDNWIFEPTIEEDEDD